MDHNGFYKFILPWNGTLFEELSRSADFEDVAKGRKGNHLVDVRQGAVPIVRTTTKYTRPANTFATIHNSIATSIENAFKDSVRIDGGLQFNNALIEIYNQEYVKMNYHSDQALDLEADSYIALFSCYERPEDPYGLRKLKVKSKTSDEEFEFLLENNSVILFSLSTNKYFQHKIVAEPVKGVKQTHGDNRWLGITFRQSRTFIHFKDNVPYFSEGEQLVIADEDQSREFYKLRGEENNGVGFEYPRIPYTLSIADTIFPKQV